MVRSRIVAIGSLAMLAAVASPFRGGTAIVLGIMALGLPAAGLAVALGSGLIRPTTGSFPWADVGLLGILAVVAAIGGILADRLSTPTTTLAIDREFSATSPQPAPHGASAAPIGARRLTVNA
jgi:hypothetical protein